MRGHVRHAVPSARGTGASALAREGQEQVARTQRAVNAAEAPRGIAAGQESAQLALDVGRQAAAAVLVFETREESLEVLAHEAMERRAGRVATQDLGERIRARDSGAPMRLGCISYLVTGAHPAGTIGSAAGCDSGSRIVRDALPLECEACARRCRSRRASRPGSTSTTCRPRDHTRRGQTPALGLRLPCSRAQAAPPLTSTTKARRRANQMRFTGTCPGTRRPMSASSGTTRRRLRPMNNMA